MTDTQRSHGGPLHRLPDKVGLAMHIGEEHVLPDGTRHRIVAPGWRVLQKWTRQELEQTHAAMHEGVTK